VCGECHGFDEEGRVVGESGWIVHGQQDDEYLHSPHNVGTPHADYINCGTCHNQHASTIYEQGGIKENPSCELCHENYEIPGKESFDCIDCHMPYSVKSAKEYSDYKADMRSHLFRIWVTEFPKDSMFYSDASGTYLKTDLNGIAFGNTLDLVCLRCHSNWTIDDIYEIAENIHTEGLSVELNPENPLPEQYIEAINYPNPFNPTTTIQFNLNPESLVNLSIFDVSGAHVETLIEGLVESGIHHVYFDGSGLTSGLYFYRIRTQNGSYSGKMLLIK